MCIYSYMSISRKQISRTLLYLLLLLCSSCSQSIEAFDVYWVVPGKDNTTDIRWRNYLTDQLNRRAGKEKIAVSDASVTGDVMQVIVDVDNKHRYDYSVFRDGDTLRLIAQDDSKMLWLIYQFMSGINDKRINVSDLPPAVINMKADADNCFT